MQIVLFGCSEVGATLAAKLYAAGHSLILVDEREDSFDRLPVDFAGFTLAADMTEAATWRQLRLERADIAFVLTDDFPLNLMLASVAMHHYHVAAVIGLARNSQEADVLKRLGLGVVQADQMIAEALLRHINPAGGRL